MDLRVAAELAIGLARDSGDFAVSEREGAQVESKGAGADLVTHVDREVERRIATVISANYPDHSILGEENGEQGAEAGDYRWLIDPLDGTNNYVLGLDVYGVCITLCHHGEPVVAVVHDSPRRRTHWAIAGQGAWVTTDNAPPQRVSMNEASTLAHTTVSFVQGYGVGPDDDRRNRLFDKLERGTKRVLRTWAPSADWALLAAGRLGAVVAYRNEVRDLVGGAMIAQEAGATVYKESAELVVVGHPDTVRDLQALLGDGF